MEEVLQAWDNLTMQEDFKLTNPRASTPVTFEVFSFIIPKVESKGTHNKEDLSDEEDEQDKGETTLVKMDV